MRVFYILAVICMAGPIYAIPTSREYAAVIDNLSRSPQFVACTREANFDFATFEKQGGLPLPVPAGYEIPREVYCVTSCMMLNMWKRNISDPPKSIEEAFTMAMEQGASVFENRSVKRDFNKLVKKCSNKGLSNCDYLRCVNFFEPPVINLFAGYRN